MEELGPFGGHIGWVPLDPSMQGFLHEGDLQGSHWEECYKETILPFINTVLITPIPTIN